MSIYSDYYCGAMTDEEYGIACALENARENYYNSYYADYENCYNFDDDYEDEYWEEIYKKDIENYKKGY